MRNVGIVAMILAGIGVLAAAATALSAASDARRYLRMRRM
jgi:hypothetical protein